MVEEEITDLRCPECLQWFTPKDQPPRPTIRTCGSQRCTLKSWRRRKREAAKDRPQEAPDAR